MTYPKPHFIILLLLLLSYACGDGKEKNESVDKKTEKERSVSNEYIYLIHPKPNTIIDSSLHIKGKARGYWFFEGDFPIELKNENGMKVLETYISATDKWMTEDFVKFEKKLMLPDTLKGTYQLILRRANPSGLPQHADSLIIPVRIGP